jgi:hypothetical protein
MPSALMEAVATPFFAIVDFTLAAPWTAAGTLAAMGVSVIAAARFFLE